MPKVSKDPQYTCDDPWQIAQFAKCEHFNRADHMDALVKRITAFAVDCRNQGIGDAIAVIQRERNKIRILHQQTCNGKTRAKCVAKGNALSIVANLVCKEMKNLTVQGVDE